MLSRNTEIFPLATETAVKLGLVILLLTHTHAHAARVGEAAEQRVCGRQGQMAGGSRHLRMRQLQERWEFEAGRWGFHEGKLQPGLQEPVFFEERTSANSPRLEGSGRNGASER